MATPNYPVVITREMINDFMLGYNNFLERMPFVPLKKSKSKAAFKSNVKAEVAAGKPVKQAVAIAYSVKRRAGTGKYK